MVPLSWDEMRSGIILDVLKRFNHDSAKLHYYSRVRLQYTCKLKVFKATIIILFNCEIF